MGDPPSKADRRVLHHVLQAEFCAALVMLTHVSLATKDAQWWATTLQFVGAVVTFAGLFWATSAHGMGWACGSCLTVATREWSGGCVVCWARADRSLYGYPWAR
jgi:hypothetical protein